MTDNHDVPEARIPRRGRPPPAQRGVNPTRSFEGMDALETGVGSLSISKPRGTPPRAPIRRPAPARRGVGASKSFDSTTSNEGSFGLDFHVPLKAESSGPRARPAPTRRGVNPTRSFEGINALETGASTPSFALKSESTSQRKTMPVRRGGVNRTYSPDTEKFSLEMGNASVSSINSNDGGIGTGRPAPPRNLLHPQIKRPTRTRRPGADRGIFYNFIIHFCGRFEFGLRKRGMSLPKVLVALALLLSFVGTAKIYSVLDAHLSKGESRAPQLQTKTIVVPEQKYQILLTGLGSFGNTDSFHQPNPLDHHHLQRAKEPHFGGLDFDFLIEDGAQRNIIRDFEGEMTDFRDLIVKERDDDQDMYYAFDDDLERGSDMLSSSEKKLLPKNKKCRRISEHRLSFPVCNSLHEQALLDNHAKYLSYGGYREVFKLDHDYAGASEALIVKELRFDLDTTLDMVEFVRMDAIVAERLTSSPLTFDIYGFCGLTVVSEFFQYGDIEKDVLYNGEGELADGESLNDAEDVDPKNDFTPLQKLELSLQMAESLAVLHNYPGGVIVHDDVQLAQFLYTSNDKTQIKLNDFNRAEFMLWDDEKQQYCDYQNGKGHGTWRAPEEYVDGPLNEKIDVWSLGNNMYSLLTGLTPFYDTSNDTKLKKLVINGKTAHIDPRYRERSLAEKTLVDVIEQCWRFDPANRPSTSEIARTLRSAIQQVKRER